MTKIFCPSKKYLMIFFLLLINFFLSGISLTKVNFAMAGTLPDFGNSGGGEWKYRQELQINPDLVGGTDVLTGFPVLLTEANFSSDLSDTAREDGCDIRFSSGESDDWSEKSFEIVDFSKTDRTAEIWVKTDLSGDISMSIWVWWGNDTASCYDNDEEYGSENVWKDGFKGVWHLDEESDGASAVTRHDSTANQNHLGDYNTVSSGAGNWGKAAYFNHLNQEYLGIKDEDQDGLDIPYEITVVSWLKMEGVGNTHNLTLLAKCKLDDYSYNFIMQPQQYPLGYSSINSSDGVNRAQYYLRDNKIKLNEWSHSVFVLNNGNHDYFHNGHDLGNPILAPGSINEHNSIYDSTADFLIGAWGRINSAGNFWDGSIGDIKIYNGVLSPDWILTEYNNQNDPASFVLGQAAEEVNEDEAMKPLILIPGIMGSWEVDGELVLDPMMGVYEDLVNALDATEGYELDTNFFAFPYQWRNSNIETAGLLGQRIEEIKNQTGADKVDIVAHSMGGLVARQYLGGDGNADNVDQLIFLATPQLGSPESYLAWEGGNFPGFTGWAMSRIFKQEAEENGYTDRDDEKRIFDYIHGEGIDSVGELLPVFNYLIDKKLGAVRVYPAGYPVNSFLENLNSASALEALGQVRISNVRGEHGNSTIDFINLKPSKNKDGMWEHGRPTMFNKYIDGPGDGTVPRRSNENFLGLEDIVIESSHTEMVEDSQLDVIELLTGKRPEIKIDNRNASTSMIISQVFSPVDMQMVDVDGNVSGKDFVTGENKIEIDGSYYTGHGAKAEFVSILGPENGKYNINLEGVEDGPFRLEVSMFREGEIYDRVYHGRVRSGEVIELSIEIMEGEKGLGEIVLVEPDSLFGQLRDDVESLWQDGEIEKKQAYTQMVSSIDVMERLSEKKPWLLHESRLAVIHLKIFKARLEFYRVMGWMTPSARDVLRADVDEIMERLR